MPTLKGGSLLLCATLAIAPLSFAAHHSSDPGKDALTPIEKAAEYPLLLRRTTLIVRDIEASLALYQAALGMEIIYDEQIARPHSSEDREQRLRLIFLRASHDHVGVIGLIDYEYGYPEHPAHSKPIRHEGFTPGNPILLFNTQALADRWPTIAATPGVNVVKAPGLRTYPGYDGGPDIKVMVSIFYDPDGYLVELNQIVTE
jgi:catechol 2,3-dioxygenase-like lactoylglutathione lyase family enzyme